MVAGQPALDRFLRKWGSRSRRVLLSDYDGTLAPFRVKRMDAKPYRGVERAFAGLIDRGVEIVLISGRPVWEILTIIPLARRMEIWGAHGYEQKAPHGDLRLYPLPDETKSALDFAYDYCLANGLESRCDRKHGSLAVHFRGMPTGQAKELSRVLTLKWESRVTSRGLKLAPFDGGIELRCVGRSKGDAVREVLGRSPAGSTAVFLGDDLTDEDGFKAIRRRGLGVLVRRKWRETAAEAWLKPPDELLLFLKEIEERANA